MFLILRFLYFDSTTGILKRGNTSLDKEGVIFSNTRNSIDLIDLIVL
jgi:hypothetical protein